MLLWTFVGYTYTVISPPKQNIQFQLCLMNPEDTPIMWKNYQADSVRCRIFWRLLHLPNNEILIERLLYTICTLAELSQHYVNEIRCSLEDILLEMDRILRPEGTVIFRDDVDVLMKVKKIVAGMRWKSQMVDHEDGPIITEKVLFSVKQYWVVNETNYPRQHSKIIKSVKGRKPSQLL